MRRTVALAQPLPDWPGVRARFREDPGTWLPSVRANGPGAWLCEVGPASAGLRARLSTDESGPVMGQRWVRLVRCEVGDIWRDGDEMRRAFSWTPVTGESDAVEAYRLLPTLDGHLHLTGQAGRLSLVLSGEVGLPLGWVGGALDVVLLRRVGDSTMTAFLQQVAAHLAPVAAWPAEDGAVSQRGR